MKDFVITCTSTCDMNPYYLRQHNFYYVSFYYYLNDEKFYDDFFKKHTIDEFYNKIKNCNVKTSQPDPEQYRDLWLKLIEQGYDILHIELDSGISGAVNSALIAKSMVEEVKNDAKIYVVDSLTASCGYGLLLDKIYDFKKNCNDIDKVCEYANKLKHDINTVFIVESLDQLIKGGRVSKVAGSIGKVLNIVPILHVDVNGKLESIKKARGLNNAMDELVNIISKNIHNTDKVFIANSNCMDNAKVMMSKVKNKFPDVILSEENITNIGTVIGSHTGEKCVVVSYVGDGRV